MPQKTVGKLDATTAPTPTKRPPLLRSVVLLLLSAGALLIFIALLGDWRREHNILAQLEAHAAEYTSRMSEGGAVPLNLELNDSRDPKSRLMDAWLSPGEARVLRGTDRRILAAWTVLIPRGLGAHGRGVIFFEHGRFNV
ncbi:MAG: hypothetical protein Q7R41_07010, partial [Phycisphaerales bacterium]|nr:hypothetical protein [Phycisphaerales bacterium]